MYGQNTVVKYGQNTLEILSYVQNTVICTKYGENNVDIR